MGLTIVVHTFDPKLLRLLISLIPSLCFVLIPIQSLSSLHRQSIKIAPQISKCLVFPSLFYFPQNFPKPAYFRCRAPIRCLHQIFLHSKIMEKHSRHSLFRISPSQLHSNAKISHCRYIFNFLIVLQPSVKHRLRILLCRSFFNQPRIGLLILLNVSPIRVGMKIISILHLSPATSTITAPLHIVKPFPTSITKPSSKIISQRTTRLSKCLLNSLLILIAQFHVFYHIPNPLTLLMSSHRRFSNISKLSFSR